MIFKQNTYRDELAILEGEFKAVLSDHSQLYVTSQMEPDKTGMYDASTNALHNINRNLAKLNAKVGARIEKLKDEAADTIGTVKNEKKRQRALKEKLVHGNAVKEGSKVFYDDSSDVNRTGVVDLVEIVVGVVLLLGALAKR